MKHEQKEFIHLIAKCYIKGGEDKFPLCVHDQEEIDVSDIINYTTSHILQLQTHLRQQREQRERGEHAIS